MSTTPISGDSLVTECIIVEVVLKVVAYVTLALRFWARRKGGLGYSWDDWLILTAAFYTLPFTISEIVWLTHFGVARHLNWVLANEPEVLPAFFKILYSEGVLYPPVISLIKLSILCFYVRMFGIRKSFARVCHVQMVLVLLWGIISTCCYLFQCSPVSAAWRIEQEGGKCFKFQTLFAGTNAVNVIMDIALLITPLHPIWHLKLPRRKKILVSGVLVLGTSEVVFSTVRLIKLSLLSYEDLSWDMAQALIWSNVENNGGIICACIPTLAPLLPRYWGERSQSSSRYGSKSKYSGNQSWPEHDEVELRDTGSVETDERELVGGTEDRIRRTTEITVQTESNLRLADKKNTNVEYML
ncbi:uncharacterized protein F4807DRAFT_153070 [Annulohypoxylon truncatum]|uniref:uncharacterized protein n=1 Tax=Annulohypoxylon truncatum TaxID=327061 RepID=UPI0020089BE0|nr:uncharacterized protein F4807DRAFT_153070 [Annulohypoxylon truncatum]KAI1208480.1 hypothetical protein F4807DRAFT_153070 [Annulohypoxylon truncatum]